MEEQLTTLLKELSQQLGTTVDYLWTVLIKQANVEVAYILCIYAFTILVGIAIAIEYYLLTRFTKRKVQSRYGEIVEVDYSILENDPDFANWILAPTVIVFILSLLASVALFDNLLSAYYNPEYWALMEIMDKL